MIVPNAMPTDVYMKTLIKAKSGQKCSIFLLVYLHFMLRFRMLPFTIYNQLYTTIQLRQMNTWLFAQPLGSLLNGGCLH